MSPAPLRNLFQWSDDEEEGSGFASSATISLIQMRLISANLANNNNDDLRRRMEAHEQTFKAQQEALGQHATYVSLTLGQPEHLMTPASIAMKRSIIAMNILRLRS